MQTLGGLAKPECMNFQASKMGAWRNPTDPGWIMEHRDWLLQMTFAA